jgi:hypothetical protein
LWSSQFNGDVGIRSSLFLVGGVKTAWGENDARRDGERLDEHVQPGTGSTDWFAGISGFYQLDRRSAIFASTQYRETGRNDFGYRYGSALLLNVRLRAQARRARWDAVIEMNYRDAGYDEVDGSGDPRREYGRLHGLRHAADPLRCGEGLGTARFRAAAAVAIRPARPAARRTGLESRGYAPLRQ